MPGPDAATRSETPVSRRDSESAVPALLALVIGVVLAASVVWLHAENLFAHAANARAVLEGQPYSIAFRSRLMGPVILKLIVMATSASWTQAYTAFTIAAAVAWPPIWFRLLRTLTGDTRRALMFTIY